jgi:ornithine cyclodeaminase
MTIVASESAEEAVRGADVVCTVTNAREPVLRRDWLAPGAHVNAVGASLRPFRELDSATVRDARVFVDSRESAASEAGDLLIPQAEGVISTDHVVGEIGDLLLRKVEGRRDDQELTLFKSLGIAVQDILAAAHVYRRALVSDRVSRSGGLPSSRSASLASLDEV